MTELIPLALILLLAGGYPIGTRRLRRHGHRWPRGRTACLMAGTLCVASALLPPVSAHDELFGVHVLQHLLLGMAGPALLALSAPITLALRTAPPPVRHVLLEVLHSRPAAFLAAPAFAVIVNLGGLYALYLTHLYAAAERSDLIHAAVHLHMFVAGCMLSWALIGTDPVRRRPAAHVRVIVLVAAAAGHDFLSKFMYARDLPFGGGSLAARHFGAELMYYGGTLVDVALAVILMTQWYQSTGRALHREERRAVHGAAAGPSPRGPRNVGSGPSPGHGDCCRSTIHRQWRAPCCAKESRLAPAATKVARDLRGYPRLSRGAAAERVTRLRDVLADRRPVRWLAGTTLAWLDLNLVSYGNTSSTWTVITLADLRASLRAVTAYTLAVFAVAALPGYLLAAAAIERPGITYFFTDFGPNTTTLV